MAFLFLDTSAFNKLYLVEKGSNWLRGYITNNQVVISELTLAETTNTLTRLYRDGSLSATDVNNILVTINSQIRNFEIVPHEVRKQLPRFTSLGLGLPANLRLRTLDAFQLIAAELAKADLLAQDPTADFTFVSADIKLLQVAQAQGFVTENPENYP